MAPEGSTPNALAVDAKEETLFIANGDNNNVCAVDIDDEDEESEIIGFIPTGWYPSALACTGGKLFVGNAKGAESASNIRGPNSPLPPGKEGNGTTKTLMRGTIETIAIPKHKHGYKDWTKQCLANCPYTDALLAQAKKPALPSVVPREVGAGSPIKHVLYIIRENRTYDQVLGDMPKGNGDARLTIFGADVTPNAHALCDQFVLLDNLFCDSEVSADGHQWSNAAYATDFTGKSWPASYGGKSKSPRSPAVYPASGYLWDQCSRHDLTYRNYGEFAARISQKEKMEVEDPRLDALVGHIAPDYQCWDARDTENAKEFLREFDDYEKHFEDRDPQKRLPNLMVMSLPEDHTRGRSPGAATPRAAVASNDFALAQMVERISHSKYWPQMAIFVIEDDAQDGPDHVDARRTVGLCISPYVRRGTVDSTLYSTCSILRTIELLLGLQPMSQYDAAANPLYAALSDTPDLTPYTLVPPKIDLNEKNPEDNPGAKVSKSMDFSDPDRAPMFALNEQVWKSVRGEASEMPVSIHRFLARAVPEP